MRIRAVISKEKKTVLTFFNLDNEKLVKYFTHFSSYFSHHISSYFSPS